MPAPGSSTNPLKARWERLSPAVKQRVMMFAAFLAITVVVWPMLGDSGKPRRKDAKPNDLSTLVTASDPNKLGLTAMSAELQQLQTQVQAITRTLERMDTREGEAPKSVDSMREQLNDVLKRIDRGQQGASASAPPPPAPSSTPIAGLAPTPPAIAPAPGAMPNLHPAQGPAAQPTPPAPKAPPRILTTGAAQDAPADATANTQAPAAARAGEPKEQVNDKEPTVYVPSGTLISGVLINGIDAPTGRAASGQPQPVLVRIKHEALLPNRYRADVRECFAILAGFGDLSSERAMLRAESFSCVRADGKVIDTKLEMYAIGEDGKAGMRGRLVSKQGSAIAKAMVAGFAQSYAQALRPQYSYYGGAGGGIDPGMQVQTGAYGGASSALDRVAKFYIDLANQTFPVVEVDAGRPVTLVVLHGSELALKSP